jgi:hypothetical protein
MSLLVKLKEGPKKAAKYNVQNLKIFALSNTIESKLSK